MPRLQVLARSIASSVLLACGGGDPTPDADSADASSGTATSTDASTTATASTSASTSASASASDTASESASSGADTTASASTSSDTTGADPLAECDDPDLTWRTGMKTYYESYPEPGSEECVEFNGCKYQGQFAACENTMPERWVAAHDLAAVFPLGDLALHRLCIRSGEHTLVVTVVDTCADADCDGCCSENRGDADALVDLEKYTAERFGVEDGPIEWADLGPGDPSFDGCNG